MYIKVKKSDILLSEKEIDILINDCINAKNKNEIKSLLTYARCSNCIENLNAQNELKVLK